MSNGAVQMSMMAAPKAHGLAGRGSVRRMFVSHSFLFFTGLCEKDWTGLASIAFLASARK